MNSNPALSDQRTTLSGAAYPGSQLVSVMTPLVEVVTESFGRSFRGIGKMVSSWNERRATVRRLNGLDAHLLSDIGLSHSDVEALSRGRTSIDELAHNRHSQLWM